MKNEEKTKEQLIEELKNAQRRIAQLEAVQEKNKPQIILEALSDMMFRLSEDGIYLDFYAPPNSPLYVAPERFLGKRIEDVLPPDVATTSMKVLQKTLSSGERQVFDYYLDFEGYERLYFEASMIVADEDKKEVLTLVHDITKRKRAEEQLLASEARWRSLVTYAPNVLFEFDYNGIIQFINMTVDDTDTNEVIGMSLFDFTPPDDHERVQAYIEQVIDTGESISYETLGIDDEWYSVRIGAIKRGEEIGNLMMILTNITELKKSEMALRQSEERFLNYMEHFPGGVFLKDEEQRLLYCNANYAEMMGDSVETILGKSTTEYIPHPDIHDRFYQQNKQVLQDGVAKVFENTYPTESEISYWETVKFPIKYPDGSQQLGGISLNVTERKLAEERLRKSEARLRSFANALPDVAFILNREEKIIDALTSREDLLYLPVEQLKGLSVRDILTPELAQEVSESIQKTLETQEVQSVEYELDVQAGHRWFDGRVAPMPSVESQDDLVVFVARDITKRKEAERKLSESEEIIALKDRIISTVSHEFRTPLALIQTASDLLTRYKDKLAEERKEALFQQIYQQVIVLAELIDDMLSISQLQSGNVELRPVSLDLVSFCQTLFNDIQLTDNLEHRFVFAASEIPQGTIELDEKLLKHILTNLLTNAVKFSPKGSSISLELDYDNESFLIKVCDEGIGIPTEDIPLLFEPFRRASNVGNIRGTGLGLSIVKKFVELLGGTISVESEVGKGTTFIVSIAASASI